MSGAGRGELLESRGVKVIVCATLAVVCLFLFLHPYLIYPATLNLFRTRQVRPVPGAPEPSVTAVFSAYNEEPVLPAKFENLRAIRALHPQIEILAYSDCSSDNTLAMLEAQSDLLTVIPAHERAGKATGMRKMAAAAHGDIMLFTDANVILDPASVAPLLGYFSDPTIGGVAGTLCYINEGESTTAKVGGLYWRLEEVMKRRESRCGSIMGADGSIFATRRALYPTVPPHLLDDMTVSMTVTFRGQRLIHATDVIAYEKSATSSADEFRRKRRIACRAFNTHRHLWPQIRSCYGATDLYKYVSHKLLRWLGLVPLALSALLAALALLIAGKILILSALIVAVAICVLLGRAGVVPFSAGFEVLMSVIATFYGVVDSFCGKTYQTWAPAASRN
jgi:cellulose synthase/poly-beta-1,6-N-acetylglucosamine synthase-like glycosyltransferase